MKSTALNIATKIADDLYEITETGSIHCYVILGADRALVFDIGYGYEDIHDLIREITNLPIMLAVSHGDPDHALGSRWFSDVWVHPLDCGKMLMNDNDHIKTASINYRVNKLPELKDEFNIEAFIERSFEDTKIHFLTDGDVIDLGGTKLEVIHTPGHSYGHIMLLDSQKGRLFSGDQLTRHNVWYFLSADEQAPFAQSVSSMKKLLGRRDEIKEIYPAHNVYPLTVEAITDQIACFEKDLPLTYKDDAPFHSFIGSDGWQHFYKSTEIIYSDERLAEWIGHTPER